MGRVRLNRSSIRCRSSCRPTRAPRTTRGNGGQANVDLRGLGTTSTLVLVDGKRLTPANGTGVVDLNIIPSSLIESVEIITGGASAVYGSDALAGVVNLKLKREFDGFQIDGTWGQTDRSDGTQYEAGLTAGTEFAGGRGSVVGFVGYADRELITQGDRDFSKYALFYVGPGNGTLGPGNSFLAGGSPAIEEGRVVFPGNNLPSEEAFEDLMRVLRLHRRGRGRAGAVPKRVRLQHRRHALYAGRRWVRRHAIDRPWRIFAACGTR